MSIIKVTAIVLKKREFSNADRELTLFTQELGRMIAIAKGISKSKNREIYATDSLVVAEFIIYQKNDKYTISQIALLEPFVKIKRSLDKLAAACYILRLLDHAVLAEEKKEDLYNKTIQVLNYIEQNDDKRSIYMVLIFYLFNLIIKEGYAVALSDNLKFAKMTENQKKAFTLLINHSFSEINELTLSLNELVSILNYTSEQLSHYFEADLRFDGFLI